jgi:hypothetical protein
MIQPADDRFHDRDRDPYWNESGWFGFMAPERSLTGFVYLYHRPNLGYTVGGVALWDRSGEYPWDCLYYDWGDPYPMSEGAEMFDFSLANGLTVEMDEPLDSFRFRYAGASHGLYENDACELDLSWSAIAPPHDTGLPSGQDEWGRGHFEQPGRMRGQIALRGETIEIDHFSERDRSWGRRRVAENPRGCFPWAIASEQSGFHVLAIGDAPPDEDDGMGPDRIISGWYLRDGEMGSISSGERRILERGPDGRPARTSVSATDSLGRELRAEGRTTNMLIWNGYSYLFQWWAQVEWELDGETAYGEEQDWWPMQQARQFLRARDNQPVAAVANTNGGR